MMKIIESCATPNGRISCELISRPYYGSTVFSVHVYETENGEDYEETHRSYHTGNKVKAKTLYKQYCNRYLRNKVNR